LTVDITVSGIGGKGSPAAEAANTFYAVWLWADSTGLNQPGGTFDVSATSPTVPSGYDKKQMVGFAKNNSTSDFSGFRNVRATAREREVHWGTGEATINIITAGTSTAYATLDLSGFCPPGTALAYLATRGEMPGENDYIAFRPADETVTTGGFRIFGGDADAGQSIASDMFHMRPDAARAIQYKCVPGGVWTVSLDLWLIGYVIDL